MQEQNEIVKYSNKVNELALPKFSALEINLFMTLCSKADDISEENQVFYYDLSDIKRMINIKDKSDEAITRVVEQMCEHMTNVKTRYSNLFPTVEPLPEHGTMKVRYNPDCIELFKNLTAEFTMFELCEIVQLKSKYSKMLYRLLKQYRSTGWCKIGIETIRERFDVPKTYQPMHILEKVIKPSVKDIEQYFTGLVCITEKSNSKRGKPVTGYRFEWLTEGKIVDVVAPDQDEHTPKRTKSGKPKSNNKFKNFSERDNDYDEIQKMLIKKSLE